MASGESRFRDRLNSTLRTLEENTSNIRARAASTASSLKGRVVTAQEKAPIYTAGVFGLTGKSNQKCIRLATVVGYVFAVSIGAIVLGIYYTAIWNPDITLPDFIIRPDSGSGSGSGKGSEYGSGSESGRRDSGPVVKDTSEPSAKSSSSGSSMVRPTQVPDAIEGSGGSTAQVYPSSYSS